MDLLTISTDVNTLTHPLAVHVYINNLPMPAILEVPQFFKAVQASGCYPLFICECGNFGCGGYCVDVLCTPQAWILKNRYSEWLALETGGEVVKVVPSNEIPLEEFEYRIHWSQVKAIAQELIHSLGEALATLRPSYQDHMQKFPKAKTLQLQEERLQDYLRNPLLQ